MAGRKPLNSAIFMKARTQIILRATHGDVENGSEVVRLIELIEAHKAGGSLNKFVLSALMNQMRSDEQRANAPLSNTLRQEHEAPYAPQRTITVLKRDEVVTAGAMPGSMPVAHMADALAEPKSFTAPPVQDVVPKDLEQRTEDALGVVTNPAPPASTEMIIESTMRTLAHQGDVLEGEAPPKPKRRMGGNALNVMG